jgi:hypothetical protein
MCVGSQATCYYTYLTSPLYRGMHPNKQCKVAESFCLASSSKTNLCFENLKEIFDKRLISKQELSFVLDIYVSLIHMLQNTKGTSASVSLWSNYLAFMEPDGEPS